MSTYLAQADLHDIAWGTTFLGAGGGGTLSSTEIMIKDHFPASEVVRLVDVEQASTEGGLTTVCGMIASQAKAAPATDPRPAGVAVDRYRQLLQQTGAGEARRLIPLELGVQSAAIPCLILALQRGMSVIDGDGGGGRAVHTCMNTTFAGYGPSPNPAIGGMGNGNTMISETGNTYMMSEMMLGMSQRDDIVIVGVSLWAMDGPALIRGVPQTGGMSLARNIGSVLKCDGTRDKIERTIELVNHNRGWARELFRGRIYSKSDYLVEVQEADGTLCAVKKTGSNVAAFRADRVIAIGPDSICWITPDGLPCSNTKLPEEGEEVIVIGSKANDAVRQSDYIMFYYQYFMDKVNAATHDDCYPAVNHYTPIEELNPDL